MRAAAIGSRGRRRHHGGMEASEVRYDTPTGRPCPRSIRADGTVEGEGACLGCGACLEAILAPPWGLEPPVGLAAPDATWT